MHTGGVKRAGRAAQGVKRKSSPANAETPPPGAKNTCVITSCINPLRDSEVPANPETMTFSELMNAHTYLKSVDREFRAMQADEHVTTPEEQARALEQRLQHTPMPWDDVVARQWATEADATDNMNALRRTIVDSVRRLRSAKSPGLAFFMQQTLMKVAESASDAVRQAAETQIVVDIAGLARDHARAHAAMDALMQSDLAEGAIALQASLCEVRGPKGDEILRRRPIRQPVQPDNYVGRAWFMEMLQPPGPGDRPCVHAATNTCLAMNESIGFLRTERTNVQRPPCREFVEAWRGTTRAEPKSGPVGPCLWCILGEYERLWVAFTSSLDAQEIVPTVAFKKGDGADDFPASYFYPATNGTAQTRPTGMEMVLQRSRFHLEFVAGKQPRYAVSVHFFVPGPGWREPPGSPTTPRPSSAATL